MRRNFSPPETKYKESKVFGNFHVREKNIRCRCYEKKIVAVKTRLVSRYIDKKADNCALTEGLNINCFKCNIQLNVSFFFSEKIYFFVI